MKISFLTLFPEMFTGPFTHSILKRAQEKGILEIEYVDIRPFGLGKHKLIDDTPYGGGIGMVMRVDVLHKAIMKSKCPISAGCKEKIILTSASGEMFSQRKAKDYSTHNHIIIICGHYEGVDERVLKYIDEEVTIGSFVVTGGELPAMLIADATARLIPGVITAGAAENESFSICREGKTLVEYPQYTKPQNYDDSQVPEVLLSGNHKEISKWRENAAVTKTKINRTDLST
jgi:tRNA (guanine37-N1)-methyltransferase